MLYVSLGILYITSLFLLAGIDKEQHKIEKSVLYYQVFVSILYIIYSCTFQNGNVYQYGIYLCIMSILILYETFSFRKNLKENNIFLIFIFILNMVIVTKEYIAIMTLLCTILSIGFENIIAYMKRPKSQKMIEKKRKTPIIFYLSVSNIIMVIGNHFLINYPNYTPHRFCWQCFLIFKLHFKCPNLKWSYRKFHTRSFCGFTALMLQ